MAVSLSCARAANQIVAPLLELQHAKSPTSAIRHRGDHATIAKTPSRHPPRAKTSAVRYAHSFHPQLTIVYGCILKSKLV
jgi:hypothetical protein